MTLPTLFEHLFGIYPRLILPLRKLSVFSLLRYAVVSLDTPAAFLGSCLGHGTATTTRALGE